jgi:hypothetical protein
MVCIQTENQRKEEFYPLLYWRFLFSTSTPWDTLKTPSAVYCEYCEAWLIEPHEWERHAAKYVDAAEETIGEVGYAGVQAGRNIVPRICPFCYHNYDLPDYQRMVM